MYFEHRQFFKFVLHFFQPCMFNIGKNLLRYKILEGDSHPMFDHCFLNVRFENSALTFENASGVPLVIEVSGSTFWNAKTFYDTQLKPKDVDVSMVMFNQSVMETITQQGERMNHLFEVNENFANAWLVPLLIHVLLTSCYLDKVWYTSDLTVLVRRMYHSA